MRLIERMKPFLGWVWYYPSDLAKRLLFVTKTLICADLRTLKKRQMSTYCCSLFAERIFQAEENLSIWHCILRSNVLQ